MKFNTLPLELIRKFITVWRDSWHDFWLSYGRSKSLPVSPPTSDTFPDLPLGVSVAGKIRAATWHANHLIDYTQVCRAHYWIIHRYARGTIKCIHTYAMGTTGLYTGMQGAWIVYTQVCKGTNRICTVMQTALKYIVHRYAQCTNRLYRGMQGALIAH
jgi:hypothetical protein